MKLRIALIASLVVTSLTFTATPALAGCEQYPSTGQTVCETLPPGEIQDRYVQVTGILIEQFERIRDDHPLVYLEYLQCQLSEDPNQCSQ